MLDSFSLLANEQPLMSDQMPGVLVIVSWISLALAAVSCLWITIDLLSGHAQQMWIMNVVWPITALWAGPFALWAYYAVGRDSSKAAMQAAEGNGKKKHSFAVSTGLAACHCGGGCTLGDIVAEWFLFFFPAISILGMTIKFELFGEKIFAAWVVDFILAFVFGIGFQYFTLKPMREISAGNALIQAVKADALSLTAWQVGMYGWMAITVFVIFGNELSKLNPVFWSMMQIAMVCGFLTSFPVNWFLIRSGIKERM